MAKKMIEIGGRLHDVSTDHVVAGADEILYEPTGETPKKQSEVNQEVDAEFNTPGTGVKARLTKAEGDIVENREEINRKQFDVSAAVIDAVPTEGSENLVRSGAIYEAYAHQVYLSGDETTDPTSFDPQADTIHKGAQVLSDVEKKQVRANLGFGNGDVDDEPIAGSENLIKSGGVFVDIMQSGVFDLTTFNSGTTYADLSAALTAMNNLPSAYKKGGMSIKFVQSSDNKYVQYRLMNQTFSTNVADWQGVDDEPISGSNNLVKSGGVENLIFNKVLIGKGDTPVYTKIYGLAPGNKYRLIFYNPNYDASEITNPSSSWVLRIGTHSDGSNSWITGWSGTSGRKPYVDFTLPESFDYVTILIRANAGVAVRFVVENITYPTAIDTELKNIIDYVYFTGVKKPTFALQPNSSCTITLPSSCIMRMYSKNGKNIFSYAITTAENYNVAYDQALYYDESAGTLSVGLLAENAGKQILFTYNGTAFSGPLASWMIANNKIDIKNLQQTVNNHAELLLNNYFVGAGNTVVTRKIVGLVKSRTYRVFFTNWDLTGVTIDTSSIMMKISSLTSGGTETNLKTIYLGTALADYYDITIPVDSAYINISGRASTGSQASFIIQDITDIVPLQNDVTLLKSEKSRRISFTRGYYSYSNVKRTDALDNGTHAGWLCSEDYISVSPGDSVEWRFGEKDSTYTFVVLQEDKTTVIATPSANDNSGKRTYTIPANAKYIRICWYKTYNGTDNTSPLSINRVPYYIDELSVLQYHDEIAFPQVSGYGIIGENYPDEILDITKNLEATKGNTYHRFHFLHVSDTHGSNFGYAQTLVDAIPAKFLINTGDLVNDKYTDDKTNTIALATAPEKPVYLVLGNHDYNKAPSKQDVFDSFIGATNEHNNADFTTSYYSIDYNTEKVKCIVLDINDGWADSDFSTLGPTDLTYGKMSSAQINWFASQLEDAIEHSYHVVVFIHTIPAKTSADKRINKWCDVINRTGGGVYSSNLTFLLDIVDAFISGGSVSFEYNGNNYSFSFDSAGTFVAWFAGHMHYDVAGWINGHENQFAVNVCRPYTSTSDPYSGTYDGDKLGVHFNYVTIDTNINSLAVYRVGQQSTMFATERKSFRILYKSV